MKNAKFHLLQSRFCAECIVTALRSGNKECPTCRKKLASKRSLRPDPNFDHLVEKIFPNRDEYEAHQESIIESLSRSHSQNFITSITGTCRILLHDQHDQFFHS